jgi:NAD(P)-dependent dehydrogenase (short-subunit alcohol dehydrogenase family)
VLVNGFDVDDTAAAVAQLGSSERVQGVHGDVSTPGVGAELVSAARSAFGRLDHVVCNAGIDIIKSAVDYTSDEWDKILDVNLRGAFLPAQAAARHWIAAGAVGSAPAIWPGSPCVRGRLPEVVGAPVSG